MSRRFTGKNIFDRMRRFARQHPTRAPRALAAAFLKHLGVAEPARTVLVPLLARDFVWVAREATRTTEKAMPAGDWAPAFAADAPVDILAIRRSLCAQTFTIGGRKITWGAATVADHRGRIAMLRDHVRACDATIRRHEEAIRLLTERGVACLNDLPAAAA
jgi:hypothetical protein